VEDAEASASLGMGLQLVCEALSFIKQMLWNPHLIFKGFANLISCSPNEC
jgi:hypothetical protein